MKRAKKSRRSLTDCTNITGVYFLSPPANTPNPPKITGWSFAGTITNALISGTDEDKKKHGGEAHGNSGKGNATGGTVWVYVQ